MVTCTEPVRGRSRQGSQTRERAALLLVFFGVAVAPLAVGVAAVRSETLDTRGYTLTAREIARQPAVRAAVAHDVSTLLTKAALTQARQQLPAPAADVLALLGRGRVRQVTDAAVRQLLATPQFQRLWALANDAVQRQLVALLERQPGLLRGDGGKLVLDVTPAVRAARDRLVTLGVPGIGSLPVERLVRPVTLGPAPQLERVRLGVHLFRLLSIILPLVSGVAIAAAVGVSRDRRRTIARVGWGLGAATLVAGVVLLVVRDRVVHGLAGPLLPLPAASAATDVVLRRPGEALLVSFAAGLALASSAWVAARVRPARSRG